MSRRYGVAAAPALGMAQTEALKALGAPFAVLEASEILAGLQESLGAALASQIAPGLRQEGLKWALRTLLDRPFGSKDRGLDALLWLVVSSRASVGALGAAFQRAYLESDPPPDWSLTSERQLEAAVVTGLSGRTLQTRLRALLLGAVLSARPGLGGLDGRLWNSPSVPVGFASLSIGESHGWCLATGEASAATGVFRAIHGHLASRKPAAWLQEAFGDADAPLGWLVYTMAMRSGASMDARGMDRVAVPPFQEHSQQNWSGPSLAPFQRFARRAVLAWEERPASWSSLKPYGIPSLDPFGSGWIHQELALNAVALWAVDAG